MRHVPSTTISRAAITRALNGVACAWLCQVGHAAAEPMVLNELRAGAGAMFNDYSSRTETTTTSPTGTMLSRVSAHHENDATEVRAGIQYLAGTLGPAGGLIYGAQFADFHGTFHDGPTTVTIDGPVVDALAGYAVSPAPGFHLEATPIAGVGYAFLNLHTGGMAPIQNRSLYIEYGLRIAAYATFDGCWQVGIEAPILVGRWRPQYGYFDGAGNHVEVSDKREKRGPGLMLNVGVRF